MFLKKSRICRRKAEEMEIFRFLARFFLSPTRVQDILGRWKLVPMMKTRVYHFQFYCNINRVYPTTKPVVRRNVLSVQCTSQKPVSKFKKSRKICFFLLFEVPQFSMSKCMALWLLIILYPASWKIINEIWNYTCKQNTPFGWRVYPVFTFYHSWL